MHTCYHAQVQRVKRAEGACVQKHALECGLCGCSLCHILVTGRNSPSLDARLPARYASLNNFSRTMKNPPGARLQTGSGFCGVPVPSRHTLSQSTTDPDTAASIDAAAVRVLRELMGSVGWHRYIDAAVAGVPITPKVWTDEPCPHHSRMMPNRHCRHCDGTGRIVEPASS